jgi:alcohol dehydrogenase
MKALVLKDKLELADIPPPVRKPGEALIRIQLAGICNTDLELLRGYMDFAGVPGHEFVGEVVASDDPRWTGRRITGEINAGCGQCRWCLEGLSRHCPKRTVLGIAGHQGAFAEYIVLPEANLHQIPDHVTDRTAVFTEPLAAALEIAEQIHLHPSTRVCVIGDGKLGLLVAEVLHQFCHDVTLVGRHHRKMALVEPSGIVTTPLDQPPVGPFDLVVEASGAATGWELALSLVRPRGTLILKSTFAGKAPLNLAPLVIDEITLIGSRCGPFPPAIQWLASGRIRPEPMIHAVLPLAEYEQALALARSPESLKVLLQIS